MRRPGPILSIGPAPTPSGTVPPRPPAGTICIPGSPLRAWLDHTGESPIVKGTLIHLAVDRLPGEQAPKPVWLRCPATSVTADMDTLWQAFHGFRSRNTLF